jgi:hypothetical protein
VCSAGASGAAPSPRGCQAPPRVHQGRALEIPEALRDDGARPVMDVPRWAHKPPQRTAAAFTEAPTVELRAPAHDLPGPGHRPSYMADRGEGVAPLPDGVWFVDAWGTGDRPRGVAPLLHGVGAVGPWDTGRCAPGSASFPYGVGSSNHGVPVITIPAWPCFHRTYWSSVRSDRPSLCRVPAVTVRVWPRFLVGHRSSR